MKNGHVVSRLLKLITSDDMLLQVTPYVRFCTVLRYFVYWSAASVEMLRMFAIFV